jgi:DNA-directed RNA polymerase omega subunit
MINPPLDELLKNTDNRYTLVNVAAKRARQIINEGHVDDTRSDKAVQIALEEIISAKTKFERAKASIK